MEQLLSAYEQLWQACGAWGTILLAATIALFFFQFRYWVRYGRIPSYRDPHHGESRPPVSVAMVLHESDDSFLNEGLPLLLGQEYDEFEVVAVDITGDMEFGEALSLIAANNPRLNVVHMVRDPRFPISDKMALNVAIKTARYDNILITTADCCPASPQWAARMARAFDSADVVIGYCGITDISPDSRIIRTACACHAVRWLSAAMSGKPYRAVIQNMGFTKQAYFSNGGFNYLNMNAGEDDLFIQKVLRSGWAAVVVSPNSLMRRTVWGGLRQWRAERKLRSGTFRYYTPQAKWYVSAELWSRALFFAAAIASIAILPLEMKLFAVALLAIRLGFVMLGMRRITRRLCEKGILATIPLYDMCSLLFEARMAVGRCFRRHQAGLWR